MLPGEHGENQDKGSHCFADTDLLWWAQNRRLSPLRPMCRSTEGRSRGKKCPFPPYKYSNAKEGFWQQPVTQQCWGRDFQTPGKYSLVGICPAWQQEKEVCCYLLHLCGEVFQLMDDVWCIRSERVKPLHPAFKQARGSSFPWVAKHACTAPSAVSKMLSESSLTPRLSAGVNWLLNPRDLLICARFVEFRKRNRMVMGY